MVLVPSATLNETNDHKFISKRVCLKIYFIYLDDYVDTSFTYILFL